MPSKQMGVSMGKKEAICLSQDCLLRKWFPKTVSSPILLQLRWWLRSCFIANSARLILKNKNISLPTQGLLFVPQHNYLECGIGALKVNELLSSFSFFLVLSETEPKLAFKASQNFLKNWPVRSEKPLFDLLHAKGYETLNKKECWITYDGRKMNSEKSILCSTEFFKQHIHIRSQDIPYRTSRFGQSVSWVYPDGF